MSNIQTNDFIVLAARYRKGNDGKVIAYLQVQSHASAPVGYVRCNTLTPPLAGTKIRATGAIVTTDKGPVMQVQQENDLELLTGQQGAILQKTVETLLGRFGVAYDARKMAAACQDTNTHLVQMNKDKLVSLLAQAGVADAEDVVTEREETFATMLTKNCFNGLESIRIPFDVDAKREMPFLKNTWPMDVMQGCLPNYIESTHGQKGHPSMPMAKNFYLASHVRYDGIDNFYRALAVASGVDGIFSEWIKENLRPATLTQSYIDEKQKQGTQIFTGSDMKQLERLGLNAPTKMAARLGNMIQLPADANDVRMIPMGVYQSSTQIATLAKLEKAKNPVAATLDDKGLDPFQKKALQAFCEGSPLTLISGPPGTGKSTLISRMIKHAQQAKEKVIVLTPTGKSSARLNESFETQFEAKDKPFSVTAHALFYNSVSARKVNRGSPVLNTSSIKDALDSSATDAFPVPVDKIMRFSSYKEGKNDVAKPEHFFYQDLAPAELLRGATVFIDESTQITGDIAALIMEMRPKRLVMTGDISQLRPVGPGKPFHDLIELSKKGHFGQQVNYVELQIDHRATKELSDFTRKLRSGEIPLDYVESYNDDADATAKELLGREAAVIECKKLDDVVDIVERIVTHALHTQKATFSIVNDATTSVSNSTALVVKDKLSIDLTAHKIVAPSVMTMAYTNAEVSQLNQTVASVLRPLMKTGSGLAHVPALSSITANGIQLGDTILQTENAKTQLLYTTPQGARLSSPSMNGEAFAFIGANTWLPLPKAKAATNADQRVSSLWHLSGLLQDASDIVTSGNHDDPQAHYELLQKLQVAIHQKNSAALQLLQMGLSEILAVSQSKLVPSNTPIEIDEKQLKRFVVPLTPPKEPDADEQAAFTDILNHVWKIDVASYSSKAGCTGIVEFSEYKQAYEKLANGVTTFTLGNSYTVHKAQGSQAKIAISVVSPPVREDEATNHEASVYTATTRAEQSSYILTHGITAKQLNVTWDTTRKLEAERLSPVALIATGAIPPMAPTLTMVTATPPQLRNDGLPLSNPKWDDYHATGFRRKVTLGSQNFPQTMRLKEGPLYLKEQMANTLSNSHNKLAGIATIPNIQGIVEPAKGPLSALNKTFVWNPSANPANAATLENNAAGAEVQDALSNLLDDFSF